MYAIGDAVRVRNDLIPEELYSGLTFVSDMVKYYNVISKIIRVEENYKGPIYQLEYCDEWYFNDEMLEPVAYSTPTPNKFKVGDKVMVVEKAVTTDKLVGLPYSFFSTLVGKKGVITSDNDKGRFTCVLQNCGSKYPDNWVIHQDNLVLLSDNSTQSVTSKSESKTTTLNPFKSTKTSTISVIEVEVKCCKKETYTI